MRTGGSLALATVIVAGWLLLGAPAAAATGVLCTIRDQRITESSGLAAAGDALYTVDDGGTSLRVFELDRSCRVRRVISNPIDPYDVEDLARGADGTLWLADIGDNDAARSTVAVERLRPDGSATVLRLRYPDGPHDAEALLLGPDGRLFVLTKEPLSSAVYTPAGALSAGRTGALRRVATLSFGPTGTAGGPVGMASQVLVTGGAVAPSGRLLVVRTYTDAYLWPVPGGDVEAALRSGSPTRVALPATAQGEAVSFAPDGRSLLTSTEGLPAPVHQVPVPAALLGAAPPTSAPGPSAPASSDPAPSGPASSGAATSGAATTAPGASGRAPAAAAPDRRRSILLPALGVGAAAVALLLGAAALLRRR